MEVLPGVHLIRCVNAKAYLAVGNELTLIDTGFPHSAGNIKSYITDKLGRQLSDVKTIILTHHHFDHIGSAHELKKLTNAKVAVHKEDADYVAGRRAIPTPTGALGIPFKTFSAFYKPKPVEPDIILKDGDNIGGLAVVCTPGHTLGSISLYDPDRKTLFTGDAVMCTKGKVVGPSSRLTMDIQQARQSIERITHFDFDIMLGGHGSPLKPNASNRVKEFYDSWK